MASELNAKTGAQLLDNAYLYNYHQTAIDQANRQRIQRTHHPVQYSNNNQYAASQNQMQQMSHSQQPSRFTFPSPCYNNQNTSKPAQTRTQYKSNHVTTPTGNDIVYAQDIQSPYSAQTPQTPYNTPQSVQPSPQPVVASRSPVPNQNASSNVNNYYSMQYAAANAHTRAQRQQQQQHYQYQYQYVEMPKKSSAMHTQYQPRVHTHSHANARQQYYFPMHRHVQYTYQPKMARPHPSSYQNVRQDPRRMQMQQTMYNHGHSYNHNHKPVARRIYHQSVTYPVSHTQYTHAHKHHVSRKIPRITVSTTASSSSTITPSPEPKELNQAKGIEFYQLQQVSLYRDLLDQYNKCKSLLEEVRVLASGTHVGITCGEDMEEVKGRITLEQMVIKERFQGIVEHQYTSFMTDQMAFINDADSKSSRKGQRQSVAEDKQIDALAKGIDKIVDLKCMTDKLIQDVDQIKGMIDHGKVRMNTNMSMNTRATKNNPY